MFCERVIFDMNIVYARNHVNICFGFGYIDVSFLKRYYFSISNYRRTFEAILLKFGQNIQEALKFNDLFLFLLNPYELGFTT